MTIQKTARLKIINVITNLERIKSDMDSNYIEKVNKSKKSGEYVGWHRESFIVADQIKELKEVLGMCWK